jgi:Uma2 family endonuclease
MGTNAQSTTATHLLAMPDDGFRYELVKGELRKMSPSEHEHGRIATRFTWRLARHVDTNDLEAVYAAAIAWRG